MPPAILRHVCACTNIARQASLCAFTGTEGFQTRAVCGGELLTLYLPDPVMQKLDI